jgi:hypothetical protein
MNTNNTKQTVVKIIDDQAENSGFALEQALRWIQKCYDIGFKEFAEVDDVAAANVRHMLANDEAHIEARVDLSQNTCAFIFCRDGAGENAREARMFTQCLAPASNSIN